MSGISHQGTRQKLLAITPFPSLKTVIDLCRSEESAAKDNDALSNNKVQVERINFKTEKKQSSFNKFKNHPKKDFDSKCHRCGYTYHQNGKCPSIQAECKFCKKTGHYATVCRNKTHDENKNNWRKTASSMV